MCLYLYVCQGYQQLYVSTWVHQGFLQQNVHVSACVNVFKSTMLQYVCVNAFNESMCLYVDVCQCFTMDLVEELTVCVYMCTCVNVLL